MANTYKYTASVGPAWVDGTTGFTTTFSVQSGTGNHTFTLPDATGTIALSSDLSAYALLAGPHFTGIPTAPTAAPGTNTTQLATTAFVQAGVPASIGADDPGISIPTTGNTISAGGPQLLALTGIRPAGTLGALTINLVDGITNSVARILSTQIITAVTITGNVDLDATRSLKAGLTTLAANQIVEYWWDASGSSPCWVRAV